MAYYTGRLVTLEKRTSEIAQPMRAMLNEPFLTSSDKDAHRRGGHPE